MVLHTDRKVLLVVQEKSGPLKVLIHLIPLIMINRALVFGSFLLDLLIKEKIYAKRLSIIIVVM